VEVEVVVVVAAVMVAVATPWRPTVQERGKNRIKVMCHRHTGCKGS
jgi:hypothetical protein